MASTEQFLHFTGMSYESTVEMCQLQVLDPNSRIYIHLRAALARRLAAMKDAADKKKTSGRRRRLVISHVLEPEQIHKLTGDYFQYDMVFKQNDRTCAGLARTIFHISVERLFDFTKGKWTKMIGFGFSLNHLIVHNRHWVHLCVAREAIDVAARSVKDDRVMCAVLNAARKKNKALPMTDMYAAGDLTNICCADPVTCKHKANVGIMLLTSVDTNYMQLCVWMLQHNVKMLYFSFPCTKATEMRYDADVPELGARVVQDGDKFHLLYKNAVTLSQTYTYANHLTLIAQTSQVIGDKVFYKEFVGYQNAMAFYKVSMSKNQFPMETDVYRSWMNVGYEKRYMIKSFKLRSTVVDIFDPRSYEEVKFEVERADVDKLIEYAMGLEPDDFTHLSIARRLRTYMTTTVQSGYNIVNFGLKLDEDQFSHVVLAVYCFSFMKRFVSGVTLRFMTGQDRDLRYLREHGALGLIPYTLAMFVRVGIVMPVQRFFGAMRILFDKWFGNRRVDVPKISMPESFVEYNNNLQPDLWGVFKNWVALHPKPWEKFSPYLPGFTVAMQAAASGDVVKYNLKLIRDLHDSMSDSILSTPVTTGSGSNSVVNANPVTPPNRATSPVLSQEALDDLQECLGLQQAERVPLVVDTPVNRGQIIQHSTVKNLAAKVVGDNEHLVDLVKPDYKATTLFQPDSQFADAHAGTVDDPHAVLSTVMGRIFPNSTLMQTDGVASDIHYGDMDIVARAVRMKIDASKLAPLRPERVFRPLMPNQVLPNAKQTMQSVVPTIVKRNLNTTSSVDPLDVDALWERTWAFMKIAYYVPDVDARLAAMQPIMPTIETAAVWASKLDEEARNRAMSTNYSHQLLYDAMSNSKLMLKAKRKTNMGPSYDTTVKAAQSIQFDPTKARTGVFSPIFADKVLRDKSVLKENVFIMQSKSPEDLNKFLKAFKWHVPGKKPLRYLELDAEMFDKSQVLSTLMMHWKKCEKFGVLPSYVKLLEEGTTYRSASSIQAGIKIYITPQRGSGDSDTLDGNCDVSQAAYARFFSRIINQIEFILIMGDDVTVAVRGDVDFVDVEADCMKEFNLSVKLTDSQYGYFVSGWLLHMPDGTINWCTDPVKRALSLGDQSVTEAVDLKERHVAYNDLCRGLEGYATQRYLAEAIADRYGRAVGVPIDKTDVIDMIKSVVTVAGDYSKFRKFFGKELFKRNA